MSLLNVTARPNIASIQPYVPGRPVSEVARELRLRHIVKLASNENSLGPSPKACEAIRAYLKEIHRYPDGDQTRRLKRKLAAKLSVRPEEIILGNGSNEILELVTRAFVNPDEEILTSSSTFLVYEGLIQIAAARGSFTPLKDYAYDLDALLGRISDRTKVIFISNPNNPTGTAIDRGAVRRFLDGVPDRILVVFDEAYYDFADPQTFPDLLQNRRTNVVVIRTFSKSYGLAGVRIGYGIADTEVIGALNKVRQPFNVNSLALVAAEAALSDMRHLRATQKMVREGKIFLEKCFANLDVSFVKSSANFILFSLPIPAKMAMNEFLMQGVIVREMDVYGFERSLRVTVGTLQENRKFAKALETIVRTPRTEGERV